MTPSSTPAPTQVPRSAILNEEDFEDREANGWIIEEGTWAVTQENDNFLYQSWGGYAYLVGGGNWSDYVLEVDTRIKEADPSGLDVLLTIRADSNTKIGYEAVIDIDDGIRITRDLNTLAARPSLAVQLDHWYKLRFEAQETELRLFIDNELALSIFNPLLTRGYVEISVGQQAVAQFDNIRIWQLT